MGGKEHVVKVIDGGAKFDVGQGGRKLLRIKITAEIDDAKSEYTITFTRRGPSSGAKGYAYARADPDSRETDAERFSALIKALTGKERWIQRMKDGRIKMACGREHIDGLVRFAELADAIKEVARAE